MLCSCYKGYEVLRKYLHLLISRIFTPNFVLIVIFITRDYPIATLYGLIFKVFFAFLILLFASDEMLDRWISPE